MTGVPSDPPRFRQSPATGRKDRNAAARTRNSRRFAPLAVAFIAAFLILRPLPAAAQTDLPLPPRGSLVFTADAATLFAGDGRTLARVYLEVPYRSLRFAHRGASWAASFDVTILVYGRKGEQLAGDNWTVPLTSAVDPSTNDLREDFYRKRYEFPVDPGPLRFEVTLSQSDSGREGDWSYSLDAPKRDPITLSDFVFGLCAGDSIPVVSEWSDSGFVPWTRRLYGDEHALLCVQGQVRDVTALPDSAYELTVHVLNEAGRQVQSWTEPVPRKDARGEFQLHPSTVDLSMGTYRLRLEARIGKEKTKKERFFEMDESRVNIFDDPHMIRVILGYVARNEEILKLEDLPSDSLLSFWNDFWKRRDPTPATPKNERLTEFLRRLEYVKQHFSILEPGWSSDMGRIYIRYGAPDEVDKTPFSNAGPPREVWYYAERGLSFVFLDTEGFGRFRLAGSNR